MDIKTMVLALALGNLSLCAALFFVERQAGGAARRNVTWRQAKQFQAVAWILLYLRGTLPDVLTIPLANVLIFTGFALDAAALWEQAGRRVWRRHLLPVLVLAIAAFGIAWAMDWPTGHRIALVSMFAAFFFFAGVAALCRRWRDAGALQRYLVLAMAVLSLAVVVRGLLSVAFPNGWRWITPTVTQQIGICALYLMMLANAFGYLLLTREQAHGELQRLEVLDPLTEVPNRRGFYQALTPWMALARRPGAPTALIILNLDHFKRVNDNYGHPVGDTVLVAMVDACRRQLRDSDLMGRLGGGEFAIQLPRTTLEDALTVADRVRREIAATPVKAEKAVINMTASLGVTTIRAEDSTVSLFKRADAALRQAKETGRNRVVEAQPAAALADV